MNGLINFILRFHFIILFILFEIFGFFLIINYNEYHQAIFLTSANSITGSVYKTYNSIAEYFALKRINERLAAENQQLHNIISIRHIMDSTQRISIIDSIFFQQYYYTTAKVINNSINKQYNYITINKGALHGIKPDMAVICPNGAVGIVKKVSNHYSLIISILNLNLKISAKIKSNNYFGSIGWNGVSHCEAILSEIPKHVKIHIGDTVITSGYSESFPEGILIGTISECKDVKGDNFHTITVKLACDFKKLSHVYVIENIFRMEQIKLEEEVHNVN